MWSNKKYGKNLWVGKYSTGITGLRYFVLSTSNLRVKDRHKIFESWQAAKKLGWVKA